MYTYENYIVEALETVSAWEVPEESFSDAVMAQAKIMAGDHLEPSIDSSTNNPYLPLQF